jgi:hypothetical protein
LDGPLAGAAGAGVVAGAAGAALSAEAPQEGSSFWQPQDGAVEEPQLEQESQLEHEPQLEHELQFDAQQQCWNHWHKLKPQLLRRRTWYLRSGMTSYMTDSTHLDL